MSLLNVNNISFSYSDSNKTALENISFSVEKGEYVVILGSNGSGKSTLARIICGFINPDSGNVEIEKNKIVGIVFQYPKDQIVSEIVSRDTKFGPENLGFPPAEVEQCAIESLAITGLLDRANSKTNSLSLGQTQKLALSGILAMNPELIVLDEATSMLDPASAKEILDFLDFCNERGQTVIHITHDYEQTFRASRVIVLQRGKKIFDGSESDFHSDENLVKSVFGEPLEKANRTSSKTKSEAIFRAENLRFSYEKSAKYSVLNDFSLSLEKGTLTAITGLSGCGKSTFMEAACGLLKADSGKIFCAERPLLALQDSQAALYERYAADDVAFGPKNRGISGKELKNRVRDAMNIAGIPFDEFADRQTFLLSGGEKRKLSIAGILAIGADVIFFDEPTAGLDSESRKNLLNMFRALTKSGKTILFSTHRMDEASFADRHVAMKNGSIATDTNPEVEDFPLCDSAREIKTLDGAAMLETLRKTTFFSDSVGKSGVIGKLPPVLKYIVFLLCFCASLFAEAPIFQITMIVITLIYAISAKCSIAKIFKTYMKVVPWLLILAIIQLLLFPATESDTILFQARFLIVTTRKIVRATATFVRTFCAFGSIIVFADSTDEREILEGFSSLLSPLKLIRVPTRSLVVIIEIIFRFIPLLIDEASSIMKTQLVRGGLANAKGFFAKIKIMIPLLIPLVIQTVKRSEALADALTARHF